jgi:hypothetical protein
MYGNKPLSAQAQTHDVQLARSIIFSNPYCHAVAKQGVFLSAYLMPYM